MKLQKGVSKERETDRNENSFNGFHPEKSSQKLFSTPQCVLFTSVSLFHPEQSQKKTDPAGIVKEITQKKIISEAFSRFSSYWGFVG